MVKPIIVDDDKVRMLYSIEKKSGLEIGRIMNVDSGTIYNSLKRQRISRRTISQSLTGKKLSKESKEKLMGRRAWNLGLTKENCKSVMTGTIKSVTSRVKKSPKFKKIYTCKKCNKQFEFYKYRARTYCSRNCYLLDENPNLFLPLENNLSWKGGKSFEPYTSEFNKNFKRLIRKRDNYICLKCNKHQEKNGRSLDVHHMDYNKENTIPQNCCALCRSCNSEVNFNRKHWIKFFQSLLAEKYGYQYTLDQKIILDFT